MFNLIYLTNMLFKENPQTRQLQVALLKEKLSKKFDLKFENKILPFKFSKEHTKMCWVANNFAKFIRSEDNSLRGFKTRCTASFICEPTYIDICHEE